MELAIGSMSPGSGGASAYARAPLGQRAADDAEAKKADADQDAAKPKSPAAGKELTAADRQLIAELQMADRTVRAHEGAHKAVGGELVGGATYSYQTGPDGRRYAIGGEVSIDSGAEREPPATITKMRRVIAAALAPAEPSAQDRAVAGQARATMAAAEQQVSLQRQQAASPVAKAYEPERGTGGGDLVDTFA